MKKSLLHITIIYLTILLSGCDNEHPLVTTADFSVPDNAADTYYIPYTKRTEEIATSGVEYKVEVEVAREDVLSITIIRSTDSEEVDAQAFWGYFSKYADAVSVLTLVSKEKTNLDQLFHEGEVVVDGTEKFMSLVYIKYLEMSGGKKSGTVWARLNIENNEMKSLQEEPDLRKLGKYVEASQRYLVIPKKSLMAIKGITF